LKSIIRKLEVQSLKARLALNPMACSCLADEFKLKTLTGDQKAAIARRWENALKERHGLQLALDLLERPARESKINAAPAGRPRCQGLLT
jgi:hypothetical protein